MTKEEAIRILDNLKPTNTKSLYDVYVVGEAITMAIKALEQEPCEDCISRQAVLNCLTATKLKKFDFILHAREEIKKLPLVTSHQKTGHWIECDVLKEVKCSNCRMCFRNRTDYCPNCGARMIEPQERSILDKIRAEIEEYKSRQLTLAIGVDDLEKGKQIALEYLLAILDKYKAESEEE